MSASWVIKSRNKILELGKHTIVIGVLNVTPDSFSDGGKFFTQEKALSQVERMLQEGAEIIDIGGESTRPNAVQVDVSEELRRVIPIIEKLRQKFGNNFFISVDTYKGVVAKEAILAGADIVNEVSGLQMDSTMPSILSELQVPIILNHMNGTPQTMQEGSILYKDVIQEIMIFFKEKVDILQKIGVKKQNIFLDPGFGFGKTVEHNLQILARFHEFTILNLPTMIGVSRKSTLGDILQETFHTDLPFPSWDRLEAGIAATIVAVLNGANIVRTHDVLQTKKALAVIDKIKQL